jgi:protein-S-isoprenylcysteine O-methyltransferase Ste14
MLRAAIFAAASAGIVLLSRKSLRAPRSHGFYRFFAFEALLGLILLNAPRWFRDPLSFRQLVSWTLLAASVVLVAEGVRLLRRLGKPATRAEEDRQLAFENTTALVTTGLYRFIRQPLYAPVLFLGWGACLKSLSAPSVALALTASVLLTATAVAEERENIAQFGTAYLNYMKSTRRFIPFVF